MDIQRWHITQSGGNRITAHNPGKPLRNAEFSCGHLHYWKGPENSKERKQKKAQTKPEMPD